MSKSRRTVKDTVVERGASKESLSAALASASVVTVTTTAALTAAIAEKQTHDFDRSLWNPAFVERDRPLNEVPIIDAHNAGAHPGSGTTFLSQNEHLTTSEILDQTPAKAISIYVEDDNGVLISNHGANFDSRLVDRTVSNPVTLDSQLDDVKQWLDKPENSDEVVIIRLKNAAPPEDRERINQMIRDKFGDQLYDRDDFFNEDRSHGWPSRNELAKNGKHVIVCSNINDWSHGYQRGAPTIDFGYLFGKSSLHANNHTQLYHPVNEDRTLLGSLAGDTQNHYPYSRDTFVGRINTEQSDALIKQGGILTLDQVSSNDPRFVAPEHRHELALDPDVSLFGGIVYVKRGVASIVMMCVGLFSNIGAGIFGIAEAIYSAHRNHRFIENLDKQLMQLASKDHVRNDISYYKNQLMTQITYDVLRPGIQDTVTIATSIFFSGVLFPVAFPVTSAVAIAVLGVGLITTGIAAYWMRKKVSQKIDVLTKKSEVKSWFESQKRLSTEPSNKEEKRLSKARETLLFATLALRVGSLAKYTVAFIGVIAGALIGVAVILKSALDGVLNYKERQRHLKSLPQLTAAVVRPVLYKKRFFGLFGKTKLERYLSDNHAALEKYQLSDDQKLLTPRALVKSLMSGDEKEKVILKAIEKECSSYLLIKDFDKFCKKASLGLSGDRNYLIPFYLEHRLNRHIGKDVRLSGRLNAMKIACVIGGLAPIIAAPYTGLIMLAALGIFFVSVVITQIVSHVEQRKFQKAAEPVIHSAMYAQEKDSNGLVEIIARIKEGVEVSKVERKPAVKKTTPPWKGDRKDSSDANASSARLFGGEKESGRPGEVILDQPRPTA